MLLNFVYAAKERERHVERITIPKLRADQGNVHVFIYIQHLSTADVIHALPVGFLSQIYNLFVLWISLNCPQ